MYRKLLAVLFLGGVCVNVYGNSWYLEASYINLMFDERLGIILGSIASGIVGYLVLNASLPSNNQINKDAPDGDAPVS